MYIAIFIKETPTEEINCMTVALGKLQITFAIAETNWQSKEKKRKIPIWISKKGLFVFRLAIGVKIVDK